MKNTFFLQGHAMLIMFFVSLNMIEMGWVSYVFLGVSVLLYFTASMLSVGTANAPYHEILTSDLTHEQKEKTKGIVIWRNLHSHSIHYWCGKKKEFIHSTCIDLNDLEVHTLLDYEIAAQHAKMIYNPGMLWFLDDEELFPKDESRLN